MSRTSSRRHVRWRLAAVAKTADELREQGYSPTAAAIEAARTRLRPVLMSDNKTPLRSAAQFRFRMPIFMPLSLTVA